MVLRKERWKEHYKSLTFSKRIVDATVCLRRLEEPKLRGCGNKPLSYKATTMKRTLKQRGPAPKRTHKIPKPSPRYYECPEGDAFINIADKRHKIRVLLDSGSNIFLLNQQAARKIKVPYETRKIPLKITAFNGETSVRGGKYYTHPIKLEIGTNGHTTMVSCDIANAGKSDMIIPFGWWHEDHPIKNIAEPGKWSFEDQKCQSHIEDEGIADMFEWDQNVAFEEEGTYIGRIGSTRKKYNTVRRIT